MPSLDMPVVAQIHLLLFIVAGLLGMTVVIWGLANQEKQATIEYAIFAGAASIWCFLVGTQLAAPIEYQYVFYVLVSLAQFATVSAWFYFTVTYTGFREQLSGEVWLTYAAITGAVFGLIAADPWTGLAFGSQSVIYHPFTIAGWSPGPFGFILPIYTYTSFGLGTLALVYRFVDTGYAQSWQAPFLIALNIQLIVINNIDTAVTFMYEPVDYTALSAPITATLYLVAMYRHDVFGFAPVARETVLENMHEAVITLNPQNRVISYNNAAEVFLSDETVDSAIGAPAEDVLPDAIATHDLVQNARSGTGEIELEQDEGPEYYDMSVNEVANAKGRTGLVITLRDITTIITQQQRLEEQATELERQASKLERKNERLDKFAGSVAHDLRNPLTIAKTYLVDARKDERSEAEQAEELDTVADSLDRMDEMIDDVLQLARQGDAVEKTQPVELHNLAEETFELADTADASLTVTGERTVDADKDRLKNLFENLFRNAADHGPNDVEIYVDMTEIGFAVEDTGPGIPPEERDSVFEQGYTTSKQGTGFGLSIVHEIVKAHDWEIDVTAGKRADGARFEITTED